MSTLEKLHSAILQYLDEKVTDYAIMVNGVWGSGKTYFLKHKLFPELAESKKELKLIYISLFGVTGSSDLNRRIYLEMYPFFNSKVAKTVGVIGKAVISNLGFSGMDDKDQDKLLETLGKIDTNTLIVFDDLERLDESLLIEILGFINQMVEHNNIKVIISANEKEVIESVDADSGNYKRYIEKVVRHKLLFELDFNETGNEILKKSGIDGKHHGAILEAFNKGENRNLRTLQFASSMSLKILESLGKVTFSSNDLKTHVEGLSLYFMTSLTIDSKLSRMKYFDMKKLASWSADKPIDFSKIDFSNVEVVNEDNRKKLKNKEGSPQQDYFDRYYSPNQMMYIDSLVDYLESGFWDEKRFLKEIESVAKYLETKGVSEANRLLESLFSIIYVDDDKINEVVDGVLKFVETGEYQIDKYLRIYFSIQGLIEEKLIKYETKKLSKKILKGIDACKDQQPTHYIEDFVSIGAGASSNVKEIYSRTIERNKEIKAKNFTEDSEAHLNLLFADPDGYNRKYLSKQGDHIPCLHFSCTPKQFLKKFTDLPNGKKAEFNGVFYQRQKNGVVMDKSELQWMRDLNERLEKEIRKEKPAISVVNMKHLKQRVEKVIADWANVEDRLDS